jgi:hypothetical protein
MSATRFCAQWCMTFLVQSDSDAAVKYRVQFDRGLGPSCTCPAFRKSRGYRHGIRECKHVLRVMQHACLWNEQWYSGGDNTLAPMEGSCTAETSTDQRCPRCAGPVISVTSAV